MTAVYSQREKKSLNYQNHRNLNRNLFLDTMQKELLNQKKENRVQGNLKNTEREALYCLANYNKDTKSKNLIRTQEKEMI